jgi:hypothetical protein
VAASLITSVVALLDATAGVPKVFMEQVPSGQGLYTPGAGNLPAVVLEDNGQSNNKYLTGTSGNVFDCQHMFTLRVYAIEDVFTATVTMDIAKLIADVLTPDSITLSGSSRVRIFRQDGFNAMRWAGPDADAPSGKWVYMVSLPYVAIYNPPW